MLPPVAFTRAHALIELFWQLLAYRPTVRISFENSLPRPMEYLFNDGLEIPVIRLPHLTQRAASRYLAPRTAVPTAFDNERPLWGLLHIGPPYAAVFIDRALHPHQRRYVLAHEVGHSLADILWVHQQWYSQPATIGDALHAFFFAPTTPDDDLWNALRGLPPRPGIPSNADDYLEREILADRIARELIAPWGLAHALAQRTAPADLDAHLITTFGLPPRIARGYGQDLRYAIAPPRSAVARLFDG